MESMTIRDQNGSIVTASITREEDGTWGATVWFGSRPATEIRRYYYATREYARHADISDDIGKNGRVR
jgi:hypothetical protein